MGAAYITIYVDGSYVSGSSQSVTAGQTLAFTRSGCTFGNFNVSASGGWQYATSGNSITFTAVDESLRCVVIVNFVSETYSVAFDPNGGTVSPQSAYCTPGTSVTLPTPARDGYACTGWWTAASGGTLVGAAGASYTPAGSTTVYAQWTAIPAFTGPATVRWLQYVGSTYVGDATNIVTNVVTKSYVESLGISAGLDEDDVAEILEPSLEFAEREMKSYADAKAKSEAETAEGRARTYTDDATNAAAATVTRLATQVESIAANLNAEDARFVSTNYNSETKMPEAYVEVKLADEATSANYWYRIWSEMTRWNAFLGTDFTFTGWVGFHAWATNVAAQIDACAPREYAFYDGVTGDVAPDGFFRITDSDGDVQFEIVKGDKTTVFANAYAMTNQLVNGVTHWYTTYAVTNAIAAPTFYATANLASGTFVAQTDSSCPANVSWTLSGDTAYLEWWPKGNYPAVFGKADYQRGGETYIRNAAPVSMQKIVIGGVTYTIGTATISGSTVLTLTP